MMRWELVGIGGNWWELVGIGGNWWDDAVGIGGNWWELVGNGGNWREKTDDNTAIATHNVYKKYNFINFQSVYICTQAVRT